MYSVVEFTLLGGNMKKFTLILILFSFIFPTSIFAAASLDTETVDRVTREKFLQAMKEITIEKIDESLEDKPIHYQMYLSDMVLASTGTVTTQLNKYLLKDAAGLFLHQYVYNLLKKTTRDNVGARCTSKKVDLICEFTDEDQISFFTYQAILEGEKDLEGKTPFKFYETLISVAKKRYGEPFDVGEDQDGKILIAKIAKIKAIHLPKGFKTEVENILADIKNKGVAVIGIAAYLKSTKSAKDGIALQKKTIKYLSDEKLLLGLNKNIKNQNIKIVVKYFQGYIDFIASENVGLAEAEIYIPTNKETKDYFALKVPDMFDEFQEGENCVFFVSIANSQGFGKRYVHDADGNKQGSSEKVNLSLYHEKIGLKIKWPNRPLAGKSVLSTNIYAGGLLYELTPHAKSSYGEEISSSSLIGVDLISYNWRKLVAFNLFFQRIYINIEKTTPVEGIANNNSTSQIDMFGVGISIPLGDYLGAL